MIPSIRSACDTLRLIGRANLDPRNASQLRHSFLKSVWMKRFRSGERLGWVADFKVHYLDYSLFMYLFREVFLRQEYFFETTKDDPIILDCGSNIGMSVLFFKYLYPRSHIIAFEPNEYAYRCLEKNVEANRLGNIFLRNAAVSDKDGKIKFYVDDASPGSLVASTLKQRMPKLEKTVDAVRLSTFIDREIDFVKLDVEGAEWPVLNELCLTQKIGFVRQMAIEYHHHIQPDEDNLSSFLSLLEKAGFGYQLIADMAPPLAKKSFQDMLILAYNKTKY